MILLQHVYFRGEITFTGGLADWIAHVPVTSRKTDVRYPKWKRTITRFDNGIVLIEVYSHWTGMTQIIVLRDTAVPFYHMEEHWVKVEGGSP